MYSPPGVAVQLSPDLPSSAKWIAWFMIIQFQAMVGDIIIVFRSTLNFVPPLEVIDDTRQQIYRMYHIYNRNLYICVIPSITTAALLGEFVLPRVLGRLIAILQPSVVVWWANFGIPRHRPT